MISAQLCEKKKKNTSMISCFMIIILIQGCGIH
jgi:hypothetical protein